MRLDSDNQSSTSWGIYISQEGVIRLASILRDGYHALYGEPEEGKSQLFVEMAYQVLLRHELEHYKIEAFALHAEMLVGRPIYVPYLFDVYACLYPGEECLEEGLANASVLNSVTIRNLFRKIYALQKGQPTPYWQGVIADQFFSEQPAAYRNYDLQAGWEPRGNRTSRFDDRPQAMNYLCNQIMEGQPQPHRDVPFYAFPPDNYFLRAENLVPIHIVASLDAKAFIQVPTPKRKVWEKFLRLLGYYETNRGKGRHVVWRSEFKQLPDLTISYHRNELDFKSFRSSLRNLGLSIGKFNQHKGSKKGQKRLAQIVQARFSIA